MPSQDVVLGLYYMTRERINAKGEGMIFADAKEVQRAYDTGQVHLQAKIKVRVVEKLENENGDLKRLVKFSIPLLAGSYYTILSPRVCLFNGKKKWQKTHFSDS